MGFASECANTYSFWCESHGQGLYFVEIRTNPLLLAPCSMPLAPCLLPHAYAFSLHLTPIRIIHFIPLMYKTIIALILSIIIIACAGNESSKSASAPDGKAIYSRTCILCHGSDGKLGLNGSKDITISKLTLEERIEQIRIGKNTMTPFEGILTPEEIQAVAAYSMTLK